MALTAPPSSSPELFSLRPSNSGLDAPPEHRVAADVTNRLLSLPEKTYGGKDVLGVEIAENVNVNDGKPAFFNMGVHHAREWPAGELAMEWAIELVDFARYRMKTRNGKGTEVRRVTLLRRNGRFSRRPDFHRRATCDLLPSYKLERAAFGGSTRAPLRIAYRVATRARAQVTVLRGRKGVKRYKARTVAAKRTHRLHMSAAKLAKRGDHRVRIVVGRGTGRVTSTLVSRRL